MNDREREALRLCAHKVRQYEKAIDRLLEAEDAGEMGNRDAAIQHLRRLRERA